jgi:hypothetical protein
MTLFDISSSFGVGHADDTAANPTTSVTDRLTPVVCFGMNNYLWASNS